MTYDRRTGKPIASFVTKIGPEVVSRSLLGGSITSTCIQTWVKFSKQNLISSFMIHFHFPYNFLVVFLY